MHAEISRHGEWRIVPWQAAFRRNDGRHRPFVIRNAAAQYDPLGNQSTTPLGETGILDRHSVPRHHLTLDDYHRLGQAGILGGDDRVKLLEGQLVDVRVRAVRRRRPY